MRSGFPGLNRKNGMNNRKKVWIWTLAGEMVTTFDLANEAATFMGLAPRTSLGPLVAKRAVIKGKWVVSFDDTFPRPKAEGVWTPKILAVSLDGEDIIPFDKQVDAANHFGVSKVTISLAIKHGGTVRKYRFSRETKQPTHLQ